MKPTFLSSTSRLTMAALALTALVGAEAMAANERSDMGTVTNNQTYNGGNYYDQSSAERSNVHLRPLAIDPDHNAEKESRVNLSSTTVTSPAYVATTPGTVYAPAPAAQATIVGNTRVYNTEPRYLAPNGTVSTTTTTATERTSE